MRAVLAICFVTLYLIALCRPIAPLLEYYGNQEYFAKVLCINQDKPELQCNGQCILMQKLKKISPESSSTIPLPKISMEDYPIGFVYALDHTCSPQLLFDFSFTEFKLAAYLIDAQPPYHPPRFS